MEKMLTIHEGEFRCQTKNKDGQLITTDLSADHGGKGEAYSPVDLAVISLSSCILTVMAIVARQHSIDLKGAKIEASYDMADKPARRIGKIYLSLSMPAGIPEAKRATLERTVRACPVHNSLHPEIQYSINFNYAG